ncbi:hypothetical protein QAD02_023866 [Eretmocerus hayati]|uniref:Uncharacterized protein n=1 Tax=Eretmocerus hayati TaxID=131215 RepID=A0ACC2PX15_9HYME|nr:hypothetical protein QAD02_023866 [Eretmocerus hayati]
MHGCSYSIKFALARDVSARSLRSASESHELHLTAELRLAQFNPGGGLMVTPIFTSSFPPTGTTSPPCDTLQHQPHFSTSLVTLTVHSGSLALPNLQRPPVESLGVILGVESSMADIF